MDLEYSDALEDFRRGLREFIAGRAPSMEVRPGFRAPVTDEDLAKTRKWKAALYSAGYLGADWPWDYGGRPDRDPLEDFVVVEEIARAGLPPLNDQTTLAAHAIIRHGSEQQCRRFLPAIRSGTELWSQLFSEPDAGSDLANISAKAAPIGDDVYLLTGQKVWSTNAQVADFGFLIARTDPESERHRGLSAFALDMGLPGIDVRPLREITGTADFNEVFFDEVRLPADALIGAPGQGWAIAMDSLAAERTGIGAGAARLRSMFDDLLDMFRGLDDGPSPLVDRADIRLELAELHAEVEVANLLAYATMTRDSAGRATERDIPVGKLAFSELNLRLAEYAVDVLGARGLLGWGEPGAPDGGRWNEEYLYARTYTIAGGSSEIMRNLLAERALGLPRDRSREAAR